MSCRLSLRTGFTNNEVYKTEEGWEFGCAATLELLKHRGVSKDSIMVLGSGKE
jgi:hypothetical protein